MKLDRAIKCLNQNDWAGLNTILSKYTETDVKSLLSYEIKHGSRRTYVRRLFARFNELRRQRELEGFMGKLKNK